MTGALHTWTNLHGAQRPASTVTGTCPVISFVADTTSVTTTASTRVDDGCSAVQDGRRVEVRGMRQANGSIVASRVKLDD